MEISHHGILFAIATTLSWSVCIFPFTQAARRLGVNPLNHFRLLLATILLFITALAVNIKDFREIFSSNYLDAWIWLGLSGAVGLALGDYFAFRMYAILGARTGSILTTFAPAAALIFGWYLLDEKINVIGVLGILTTITGVIYISFGKNERKNIPENSHGKIRDGIVLGIMAALCQGIGLVLAKKGFLLQEIHSFQLSPLNATFIRMAVSTASLFLITALSGQKNKIILPLVMNRDNGLKFAVAGTLFGPFFGVSLALITITKLDVAVAQTFFSLVPVGALLISFLFLKEKITLQSLAGMVISLLGVVILIWRNNLLAFFF